MPEEKKLDETVPGGKYIRGDEFVDAEGKVVGKASAKDTEVSADVATPAPAEPVEATDTAKKTK